MANTQEAIRVAGDAVVSVAPVGTPAPVDASTALDAAFVEIGFTSPDGETFANNTDTTDIRVHQSFYVQRKIVTGRDSTVSFDMSEWNPESVRLAFGGGTFEDTGGGTIYHPPGPETLDERALVLTILDGEHLMRIYIPKGLVAGSVESVFSRQDAALLPIEFTATPTGDEDPWQLIWDDDDSIFAAAS